MSFWRFNANSKHYEWVSYPERHAKQLLLTYLNGRFKDAILAFEEISAGAGRIDLFISSTLGEKLIIESKMCGHNYSEAYAREGLEQIVHYMDNKKAETGYLVVFDSRVKDFSKGFQPIEEFGRKTVLIKIADVRPYVKISDAPFGI